MIINVKNANGIYSSGNWYKNVKDFEEIYQIINGKTLINKHVLKSLYFDCIYASYLDGDFVECGCGAGGSTYLIASLLREKKKLFVLDSFKGLPKAEEIDKADTYIEDMSGKFAYNYDDVIQFLAPVMHNIKIIPGWFNETLGNNADEELASSKFALVHLDVDLASSYRDCIEFFSKRIVDNGIMIFDEYEYHPFENSGKVIDKYLKTIQYTGFKCENRLSVIVHK